MYVQLDGGDKRLPGLGQNAGYIDLVIAIRTGGAFLDETVRRRFSCTSNSFFLGASAAGIQEWRRHWLVTPGLLRQARNDAAAG